MRSLLFLVNLFPSNSFIKLMEEEHSKEKIDPPAKQEDGIYINIIFSIHEKPKKMGHGLEIVYKDIHGDLEEERVNKKIFQDKKEKANIIIDTEKIKNGSNSHSQGSDKENDERIEPLGKKDNGQKSFPKKKIADKASKRDQFLVIIMKKLDESLGFSKEFEEKLNYFDEKIDNIVHTVTSLVGSVDQLVGKFVAIEKKVDNIELRLTKLLESNISLQKGVAELSNSVSNKISTLETNVSKVKTDTRNEIKKFEIKFNLLQKAYQILNNKFKIGELNSQEGGIRIETCFKMIANIDFSINEHEKNFEENRRILKDLKDDNDRFKTTFLELKNILFAASQCFFVDQSINQGNSNLKEASQGKK